MHTLFIDFETRSPVELRGAGAYRYASDPATEVMLMGYAFDDESVEVWDAKGDETFPFRVTKHLATEGVVVAHNAQFERLILKHGLLDIDIPVSSALLARQAMARSVNLPAKLDALAGMLLGEKKNADGEQS